MTKWCFIGVNENVNNGKNDNGLSNKIIHMLSFLLSLHKTNAALIA